LGGRDESRTINQHVVRMHWGLPDTAILLPCHAWADPIPELADGLHLSANERANLWQSNVPAPQPGCDKGDWTMTPEQEQRIRVLWEETPRSGSQIAAVVGVTKSAVVGLADRRGWTKYGKTEKREPRIAGHTGPAPRTIFARLDALNAKLDRVLAETEPAIRSGRAADAETLRAGEQGGPVVG
jgi:hypothetical protein